MSKDMVDVFYIALPFLVITFAIWNNARNERVNKEYLEAKKARHEAAAAVEEQKAIDEREFNKRKPKLEDKLRSHVYGVSEYSAQERKDMIRISDGYKKAKAAEIAILCVQAKRIAANTEVKEYRDHVGIKHMGNAVYVLANNSNNGIIKVGHSSNPLRRIAELNNEDYGSKHGCKGWHIVCAFEMPANQCRIEAEAHIHKQLGFFWLGDKSKGNSELFDCHPEVAISYLKKFKPNHLTSVR